MARVEAPLRRDGFRVAVVVSLVTFPLVGAATIAGAACSTSWDNSAHYHRGGPNADTCNGEDHSTGHNEYFYTEGSGDTVNAAGSATNYADIIEPAGGNDVVDGQGGYDYIRAGEGCDTVRGGYWGDLIHMGESPCTWDDALGEDGNDEIHGSYGYDLLRGGPNDDRLYDDCCGGENEKDRICGGAGSDFGTTADGDSFDYVYGDVESPQTDGYEFVASQPCGIL